MRVLVTGASGFIGRALLARLAGDGMTVRAAVRDATRPLPAGVETAVVGEIGAATDWQPALRGCDAVVHLAARAHVLAEGADAAERFHDTNMLGTARLAETAAACGVRRLVFVSTIGVFGRTADHPVTEADREAPHDLYAHAKLGAEQALAQIAARSALETVVIRPPLVYGPGAPGNLARLAALVRRGVPLPFGAIDNRRTLLGLDDLVALLAICVTHRSAGGEMFVAGENEALSTAEIARHLAAGMRREARLFPVPRPIARGTLCLAGREPLYDRLWGDLQVNAAKAWRLLGWRARSSAAEGLRVTGRGYLGLAVSPK